MNKSELIKKIIEKKEFSQLPEKDVEIAFSHFEKRQTSDEEKIRLTRELLHKVFGSFTSQKLLSPKNKSYERILKEFENKKINIIDLGAGVNGFSYKYFEKKGDYIAIESVGQLVNLMNNYFKENKISGVAYHESLFNLKKIKKIILETGVLLPKEPTMVEKVKILRIIFLFKVLDSLEMLERDYSKKLLKEIAPLADKVVISFATRSMIKQKKFKVERHWILDFIKENFKVLDDFELGGERYICFEEE